jgi:hypothetical protein
MATTSRCRPHVAIHGPTPTGRAWCVTNRPDISASRMTFASLSDVLALAPWAGLVGFGLGFIVGASYRIERRNGKH